MARRLARLITFVLALALAAPAAADPAAEEVRGKVRAAVGYDAFRKLEHGVVLDGKARHDGFPGTFTLRLRPDGRYAVVIDTKTGFATGFDGKGRWSRRCTTPALPVELRYGDIYRFQYGILGHRWLAADGGFTVAIDPAEHRPYRPCLVVRHPDCPTLGARVYLDPATWLPTRFSVLVDGGESVTEMADWRDVGGAKVPGWVAFGRYAGGSELTAATAAPAPPPPAGADPFAPPPPAADTAFVPAARAAAEAKVVDGVLLVRPAVNGAPGPWLMLNTGATSTSVAAAAADRLGLPTLGRVGVNPGIDTRYRTADRFTLGPATVSGLPLVEIPTERFAAMGEVIKAELGGMLGGDVLARVVLEADWGAGTAAVHDPRA
ncbi:MAG TPA: aspartyl protease family protein [Urbifossiella sp.]|nr:aspartyl protease family protein [Urbifossiella sp.]